MKYLYMIFRLYRCPHKYKVMEKITKHKVGATSIIGVTYVNQCGRCGKLTHKILDVYE